MTEPEHFWYRTNLTRTHMARTKQTARRCEPTREEVEAAYVEARRADAAAAAAAAPPRRDYEGWRALFAAASPAWLNDQRLVLRANEAVQLVYDPRANEWVLEVLDK